MMTEHVPLDTSAPNRTDVTDLDLHSLKLVPRVPMVDDCIQVKDDVGNLLIAVHSDGTYEIPDVADLPDAAAIFWREVERFATLCGYLRKPPHQVDQVESALREAEAMIQQLITDILPGMENTVGEQEVIKGFQSWVDGYLKHHYGRS